VKIISTDYTNTVSSTSEHADYPDDNVLTDYSGEYWQANGTNTATLTVTFSAGGANAFLFSYTNATSVDYDVKDSGASSIKSGTIDLTSPHTVDRGWMEFTTEAGTGSVELAFTSAAGTSVYCGIVRIGAVTDISDPLMSPEEGEIDNDIVIELHAPGANYVVQRRRLRTYSFTLLLSRSTDYYDLRKIREDNGNTPLAMLLSENAGNDHEWCIWGVMGPIAGMHDKTKTYTTLDIREQG